MLSVDFIYSFSPGVFLNGPPVVLNKPQGDWGGTRRSSYWLASLSAGSNSTFSRSVSLSPQSCRGREASRPSATAQVPPAAASHATSRATARRCPPTRASRSASSPPTSPRTPRRWHPSHPACLPVHHRTLTHRCGVLSPNQKICVSMVSMRFVFCFVSSRLRRLLANQLRPPLVIHFWGWIFKLLKIVPISTQFKSDHFNSQIIPKTLICCLPSNCAHVWVETPGLVYCRLLETCSFKG